MTGTCRTCRHWSHENFEALDPPSGWAQCRRTEHEDLGRDIYGGEAKTPVLDRSGTPTLSYARDVEGYRAVLFTSPDFGCVQFEAKPND